MVGARVDLLFHSARKIRTKGFHIPASRPTAAEDNVERLEDSCFITLQILVL